MTGIAHKAERPSAQPEPVYVEQLRLANFRNYTHLSLDTGPGVIILTGANGAGKTNLLESMSLLAPGRGLRRAPLNQMMNCHHEASGWAVHASLNRPSGPVSLGTGLSSDDAASGSGRKVKIDGEKATLTDMETELAVLWLTPMMDGLFIGPTAERRRFLDRLTASFEAGHTKRINTHERLIRSRNKLLAEPWPDDKLLSIIEHQIAECAVAIAYSRLALTEALTETITYTPLSEGLFPTARLRPLGTLEDRLNKGAPLSTVEDGYRNRLAQNRTQDKAAGRTLEGVHLSDLCVTMARNNQPAALGSTGQQKALLLSILMAEAALTKHVQNKTPLLLLDEIAAHLDGIRRACLFNHLIELDCQTWLTGTDPSAFEAIDHQATRLNISNATVEFAS